MGKLTKIFFIIVNLLLFNYVLYKLFITQQLISESKNTLLSFLNTPAYKKLNEMLIQEIAIKKAMEDATKKIPV